MVRGLDFIAHSKNSNGQYHGLIDHLEQVAKLTAHLSAKFNAGDVGYYAGLWHDLGKYSPDFQRYLRNPKGTKGPGHKGAGAICALNYLEPMVFPIIGHHGGLHDYDELKQIIENNRQDKAVKEALGIAINSISGLQPTGQLMLPGYINDRPLALEFFLRMLFSSLVDSDFLDTEYHFEIEKHQIREITTSMSDLWQIFKQHHSSITKMDSELNKVRDDIYQACIAASQKDPGIYRLTVPTGGGKTLSGMAFALNHAIKHNLDRVIVAIPYTSIIEQTADVYRTIFGGEIVLEHHSAVERDREDTEGLQTYHQLAAENWDAPVIVTTTVQLFESLLGHKPSCCRKLHNIAKSVLILDEVQTLPVHLLQPVISVLQELADNYRVTVVLCTATQPALTGGPYLEGLRGVQDIIAEPKGYFEVLKRVDYLLIPRDGVWTWQQVAQEMLKHTQCLVIVNTKKDALELMLALDDLEALHISTLLCGAHRRQVLAEVKRRILQQPD